SSGLRAGRRVARTPRRAVPLAWTWTSISSRPEPGPRKTSRSRVSSAARRTAPSAGAGGRMSVPSASSASFSSCRPLRTRPAGADGEAGAGRSNAPDADGLRHRGHQLVAVAAVERVSQDALALAVRKGALRVTRQQLVRWTGGTRARGAGRQSLGVEDVIEIH